MNNFDFNERLSFSVTSNGRTFESIIQETLPGIAMVEKTNAEQDKTGVDYVVTLRRGSRVFVDLKLRDKGCSRFWKSGEELALETWSVIPEDGCAGKTGWTLDEAKATHYTMHAFHPEDSTQVFLLPFQLLRKAFRQNVKTWKTLYRTERQSSGSWKSECVFVPADIILSAITEASVSRQE
jgi:hypothetical protein